MNKKPHREIGKRLKTLRAELSQTEFAKSLGIPWRSYHRYETGERVPPLEILRKAVELRGESVEWVLTGNAALGPAERKTFQSRVETGVHYRSLHRQLWRILAEGDASKMKAIHALLQALDPQAKKKTKKPER
jgi:transcriptional regulator with XRE-family HTH domain